MISCFIQNYSLHYLIIYLPQIITIYFARAIVLLFLGNFDPMKGFIKASFWIVKNISEILKTRAHIQKNVRVVSDEYLSQKIFFPGSIWDFYKYFKITKEKITPILLTKESKNPKAISYGT